MKAIEINLNTKTKRYKASLVISKIIFILTASLFFLSSSIFFITVTRWLYYDLFPSYNLDKIVFSSGKISNEKIALIFERLMNFLDGKTTVFDIAPLKYSQQGYEHFVDVKNLFILARNIFISSLIFLVFEAGIFKFLFKKNFAFYKVFAYASFLLIAFIAIIAIAALSNFDRAFIVFHHVFFPGKTNWIFDPNQDEIIQILPEELFANYAILIGVSIGFWCFGFIIIWAIILMIKKHKSKKITVKNSPKFIA